MSRINTCCFTGHRKLPKDMIEKTVISLDREVENLIDQGVTDFITGGALGFDQIAAFLIIAKKEMGREIRLIFALPCRNQDEHWTDEQKRLYRNLLAEADEIVYVSERNRYMVDRSAFCICALLHPLSGTGQTVRYAKQQRIKVINVVE